jgi:hypothetical protein
MNKIITQFQQVFGVVPAGKYGASTSMNFNFEGTAKTEDTVSLSIHGLIAYLYFNAYGTKMPDIYADPPEATTDQEKDQIYAVYDAINVPRPSL